MAMCDRSGSDPLLCALVAQGINIVLPPRDDLKAGGLIIADKSGAARAASWQSVVKVSPSVEAETQPTFKWLNFVASDAIEANAGARLLGKALAFAGLTEGGFSGALKRANAKQLDIQLKAAAVSALINLDAVLDNLRDGMAEIQPGYEDRTLYVIDKVWRARGISIGFQGSSGNQIEITADIESQLKAETHLNLTQRGDGRLTYVASEALVFGVTLRKIVVSKDTITDTTVWKYVPIRSNDEVVFPTLSNDLFVELGAELSAGSEK